MNVETEGATIGCAELRSLIKPGSINLNFDFYIRSDYDP